VGPTVCEYDDTSTDGSWNSNCTDNNNNNNNIIIIIITETDLLIDTANFRRYKCGQVGR
jgi:hypothetical protein